MHIRTLTPADAALFQALRLQALLECPSAFASSHDEERDTPLAVIADRLAVQPDRFIIGAFHGPALVGMVGLQRETMKKLAHKALLWGVYVDPSVRHQGVGRELVREAIARAASVPGVRQLILGVNTANTAAIALYEAMGFETFGLEPGFMQLDGQMHDEKHMVRFLGTG